MALSDFVLVNLSSSGPAVTQQGFGTPLFLAADAPAGFTNRVRTYNSLAGLVSDGFATTGGTYLQAQTHLAQTPHTVNFKVGRLANIPIQAWLLTPVAINAATYNLYLDGKLATYTNATPTQAGISAGLKTALDALSLAVTVVAPTLWATSHAQSTGDQVVTAAGGLFQCTASTGNTSGSGTGPTGTDGQTGITDGSVTWKCLRASGYTGSASKLVVLANTAGDFHTLYSTDVTGSTAVGTTQMGLLQTTPDAGVAADLNAIVAEDTNWYALEGQFNSAAVVTAKAVWAEANKKLHCCGTQDSEVINHAASGATDIAKVAQTASYFYTNLWYSPSNGDFLETGIASVKLTTTPGSEIWGLTSLAAVNSTVLTPTQRSNALAKNCNVYEVTAGIPITEVGKACSGEWIDVVRFKDWQVSDMETALFTQLTTAANTNTKVPYTDDGIQAIKGTMLASLKRGVAAGGLAKNPAPVVNVPLYANVSSTDIHNRTVTTATFTATLAGAIIAVSPITGTLAG